MAPEQVEVGHQGLRRDVVGVLRRGGAGLVQVDALGALEQPRHRQSGSGLGVGGLAATSFSYSATAASMSPRSRASCAGA